MNLLTLPEAAGQLAVSRRTLERLIQTGELPCIRLGRSVRIDPVDLAAMLEGVKTRACLEEKPACRSLNAALSGGSDLRTPTGAKYANLLKLPNAGKLRNTTTDAKRIAGDR